MTINVEKKQPSLRWSIRKEALERPPPPRIWALAWLLKEKKVLLVDTDPQASLTVSLGNPCPDDLSPTLSDLMGKIMMENPITPDEGILHHPEGVDLVPSNIELSGMEVALVNAMSRETILRQYLDTVKTEL